MVTQIHPAPEVSEPELRLGACECYSCIESFCRKSLHVESAHSIIVPAAKETEDMKNILWHVATLALAVVIFYFCK